MNENVLSEKYKDHASMKVSDVAFCLQLSEPSVRNYLNQGLISYVRVGPRRIVIPRSEVERILQHGIEGRDSNE